MKAASPDEAVFLAAWSFEEGSLASRDLLSAALNELDCRGPVYKRYERFNGISAWLAEINSVRIEGLRMKALVLAATHGDQNTVAVVATPRKLGKRNRWLMERILYSFEPLAVSERYP